jgi:hypothetical protein
MSKFGTAEEAFKFWAQRLRTRLDEFHAPKQELQERRPRRRPKGTRAVTLAAIRMRVALMITDYYS